MGPNLHFIIFAIAAGSNLDRFRERQLEGHRSALLHFKNDSKFDMWDAVSEPSWLKKLH